MLKKIGIHFEEKLLKELNDNFKDIKISYLINYLLYIFLNNFKHKSWEDKNELQKNIQKFILESKK